MNYTNNKNKDTKIEVEKSLEEKTEKLEGPFMKNRKTWKESFSIRQGL
ncbi:MAG: hypothetical protein N3G19_00420 [Candidatus Pacearchaeota archaeon]|nr:hypothetical protein [Candidatus Pacearchaeota archaeon]